ncbi:MAG: hypothetical protein CMC14_00755 [Flavobacteriaceae bacterium]|nr:hypothetical protein [Flavobacteriaceae bacterium]|tara:strand:+ start:326 stop:883 length:558 start_codon:yes stop_codon:yes gene_type:complete
MNNLTDDIKEIEFKTGLNFNFNLDKEFELISSKLNLKEKESLKNDFEFFIEKGKYLVINTFGGGILFLKVPERIEKINIESRTDRNDFKASVVFESDLRKVENIKYKPEASRIESTEWTVKAIFPNFFQYKKEIQKAILTVIGKIVKRICEYGQTNFAYMKIENEFEIELLIDGKIESKLKVELN